MTIFFEHVPKCGGSSLNRILDEHFVNVQHPCFALIHCHMALYRPLTRELRKPLCFSSHGLYRSLARTDEYTGGTWITFLREPFRRCCSSYRQASIRGLIPAKVSLDEWIDTYPANPFTRRFGPDPAAAFQRLNSFTMVGICDRFEQSLDALENSLGIQILKSYKVNVTKRTDCGHGEGLERQEKKFRTRHSADYELFHEFLRRLDAGILNGPRRSMTQDALKKHGNDCLR